MKKQLILFLAFILFITKVTSQEQNTSQNSSSNLNNELIKGTYISNCETNEFTLEIKETEEKGIYLIQIENEIQTIWLRTSNNTYVKEDGEDYTLTFYETEGLFKYTNYSGEVCEWIKM